MLDEIIKGATVVDGTGAPGVVADVGIADGRIVAIGTIDEPAANVFDADGLVVAPGFVDPHTHYDAQLLWDPTATPVEQPRRHHGHRRQLRLHASRRCTTGDADYLRRMMARVEGMPLAALEQGVDWKWETFGEYLDRLEGGIAVNAGFLVGHCAIRRYVMGTDAIGGEATPEQIAEMRAELGTVARGRRASASRSRSRRRTATATASPSPAGGPRPTSSSPCARRPARHPGTTLEGIVQGCLDQFTDDEIELLGVGQCRGQPPAQLERAHRRRPRARARAPPALRRRPRRRSSAAASSHSPCRCRCR